MTELVFDRDFDAAPGEVARISPLVRRVLCGNASPYTFKGTASFIVGRGTVAIIDPGPADEAHLAALLKAVEGETVSHILVTHSHADHSPLAAGLKTITGAVTVGYGPVAPRDDGGLRLDASVDHGFDPDLRMGHGEALGGAGWTLEAVHTPGHMSNHLCFSLREENALFSGDHVMAWATSVIAPPDGNMAHYMASLRLLLERDDEIYLPSHGPARLDPKALVREFSPTGRCARRQFSTASARATGRSETSCGRSTPTWTRASMAPLPCRRGRMWSIWPRRAW